MDLSFDTFSLPALILLILTAVLLLISNDWRLSLGAIGAMYIGVFVFVAISWPLEMAVVKLVAGWISASVLGISLANLPDSSKRRQPYLASEIVFRISSAGLVGLVALSLVSGIQGVIPDASGEQIIGGTLLIFLGVLHLGFTAQPLRTILGLLTLLAGFEILYATIESSVLVAGFLALINMGLAMAGAYLLLAPTLEAGE